MTNIFSPDARITATVNPDLRGLGLLQVRVSAHHITSPRFARVTTEGGLTYIMARDGKTTAVHPTLILSEDEARAILDALGAHLMGPTWGSTPSRLAKVQEELRTTQTQNAAMRKAKKALEARLREAQLELSELQGMRERHSEVMAVVEAFRRGPDALPEAKDYCS